jgi:hypothetical protein
MLRQANAGVAVARNRGIDAAPWPVGVLSGCRRLAAPELPGHAGIEAQQRHPQADVVAADFVRVPRWGGVRGMAAALAGQQ